MDTGKGVMLEPHSGERRDMREDAFNPPAPSGTRDASAWLHVGLADGRRGRRDLNPVWAEPHERQAWLDGYRMGCVERNAKRSDSPSLLQAVVFKGTV